MNRLRVGVLAGVFVVAAVAAGGAGAGGSTPFGAAKPTASPLVNRFIVVMKPGVGVSAISPTVQAAGGHIAAAIPEANIQIVSGSAPGLRQALSADPNVQAVARDRIVHLIEPSGDPQFYSGAQGATYNIDVKAKLGAQAFVPPSDPATNDTCANYGFSPCAQWDLGRIGVPGAWNGTVGGGSADVLVGVADTGLDYTHSDLAQKVASVKDFLPMEDPPICETFFGASEADAQAATGAPAVDLDFNGHGTWIGGDIAGRLNGTGVNGIAPGVSLVSLKISGWCGSAYTSTIMAAFYYAANAGLDVVSISFGGYLDRSDPDQDLIYRQESQAVNYATHKGTLIVAASGNEHTRIGAGGKVLSHGILTAPPGGDDLFGLYEDPGGLPGVVDVASTGNIVNLPSAVPCPADSDAAGAATFQAWCKPLTDAHQSFGIGKEDQLAYYSNYGPRIDIAAPGGARKFNLPYWDRGGCEGFPWCGFISINDGSSAADGFNVWEDFSTITNWSVSIPCVSFTGLFGFVDGECYNSIQGTSMATPHVSATAALIATAFPAQARHKPLVIKQRLGSTTFKHSSPHGWNATPPVSATDTSAADQTGDTCPFGWCHLGGAAIPDSEAYGAGIVNADRAIHQH